MGNYSSSRCFQIKTETEKTCFNARLDFFFWQFCLLFSLVNPFEIKARVQYNSVNTTQKTTENFYCIIRRCLWEKSTTGIFPPASRSFMDFALWSERKSLIRSPNWSIHWMFNWLFIHIHIHILTFCLRSDNVNVDERKTQ
jgi:hypothetical protein